MGTSKSIVVLLSFVLLAAGNVSSAEKAGPEPEAKSAVRAEAGDTEKTRATCVVKITSHPFVMPMDGTTVQSLLNSSGIYGEAARRVLPAKVEDEIMLEELSLPDDRISHLFQLEIYAPSSVAEKFLLAAVDNMGQALDADYERYRQSRRNLLDQADKEVKLAEAELVQMQKQLRGLAGSEGMLSSEFILEDIANLRRALDRVTMELESTQVMVNTLHTQIADVEHELEEKLHDDPVSCELRELIEMSAEREAQIKKLVDSGSAAPDSLGEAKEKLVRLRIELAQRREQISQAAGKGKIEELSARIAELTMKRAELEVNQRDFIQQFERNRNLLEQADGFEILSMRVGLAKDNLEEAISRRYDMERDSRLLQAPIVSVLGAD